MPKLQTPNPRWMWYPGDFEIHHSLKLHCRREERGFIWPAFWKLDDCWHNVIFRKKVQINHPATIKVSGTGVGYLEIGTKRYHYNETAILTPGEYSLLVMAVKMDGLPAIFVAGGGPCKDAITSADGWEVTHLIGETGRLDGPGWKPVGHNTMYMCENDNPEIFKFEYETIKPIAQRKIDEGILYDFGRQTFGKLVFENIAPGPAMQVFYGESETEALDTALSYISDQVPENVSDYTMIPRAFRYIAVKDAGRSHTLTADYEFLPLEYNGKFQCSDEMLNRIWDVAAYTFHLNSREFFLDGIKRDRWVWSGDAYQSYLINYYLFFDRDIVKRTTIALRGKDPVEQHINTIMDYTFYWIIGVADYYRFTGDVAFVGEIWPKMKTMLDFILSRLNSDGLAEGLPGDWIFIDWHTYLDKTGPLCAEQMLLARALESAAVCAGLIGQDGSLYQAKADELRNTLDILYWDKKQGAYIDSFASGGFNVTRHANIFAILHGFAKGDKVQTIIDKVLKNDAIPQITTPYFKFYELEVLCATGETQAALNIMLDYWGGMLNLGATSFWEEYDPTQDFPEHYAMYGDKYGKSLCHAWGASPIYLLGRYFLGVSPTSDAYETFDVVPNLGGLEWMEGVVPVSGGEVNVYASKTCVKVCASVPGGTLVWNGERIPLPQGVMVERSYKA
ncbi:MAG: alpha-rhamnosidase [Defluviitaleaceae bacterium]|nr:alpha-rhamnosidase [Defluviitaleaceae bacterium]